VTGVADRRRGTYNLGRTVFMGYSFGGDPEDPGEFFPLQSLNAVNQHQLGKIIRPTNTNPLLNRNHLATDVMKYNNFELTDLVNPKSLLCKTSNLLGSMQKHTEVVDEGEPNYYYLDEVDKEFMDTDSTDDEEYDYTADNEFNVKSDSGEEELSEEEKMALKVFKRVKEIEAEEMRLAEQVEDNRRNIERAETNTDKFQKYCNGQNLEAKRNFMKKMKEEMLEASVVEVNTDGDDDEEVVEDNTEESPKEEEDIEEDNTIVNVKKSEDTQLNDLEQLARLGDKSLLLERLEVEEGKEAKEVVEEYVSGLDVTVEGKVEKVVSIETKKKMLLVQFDTMTYRDAVLKASRSPGARSSSKARLRKPKVKDLKHVETLRH